MVKTRVLVVDDSAVARRLVSDALTTDPSIEVCGTASNGKIALAKLSQLAPDVVTLDVEMPEMDGLETLKALRKTHPHLPVIMFSAITERGAAATLEAIAHGASDYVTKPTSAEGIEGARRRVAADLVPRVKAFARRAQTPPLPPAPSIPPIQILRAQSVIARVAPPRSARVEIVTIGVSTGGPNALAELIPSLPADFPVPVVVVQHMPPVFTRLLADRLDACSKLEVRECQGDEQLRPGFVYIAKGDFHMKLRGSRTDPRLVLDQTPPENSCRPAVDVLFRSVAELYGAATLGVILTGMGQDGLRGCQLIHELRGQVLAQDQATSVIWGMPGAIARAGIADRILPLKSIGPELVTLTAAGSGALARRTTP
jgi:two-component system, chemotaxis family, protein-glutamate methylesterase/glutaminase